MHKCRRFLCQIRGTLEASLKRKVEREDHGYRGCSVGAICSPTNADYMDHYKLRQHPSWQSTDKQANLWQTKRMLLTHPMFNTLRISSSLWRRFSHLLQIN